MSAATRPLASTIVVLTSRGVRALPTIRGDAVHFGGHVFAATQTPNAFLVRT